MMQRVSEALARIRVVSQKWHDEMDSISISQSLINKELNNVQYLAWLQNSKALIKYALERKESLDSSHSQYEIFFPEEHHLSAIRDDIREMSDVSNKASKKAISPALDTHPLILSYMMMGSGGGRQYIKAYISKNQLQYPTQYLETSFPQNFNSFKNFITHSDDFVNVEKLEVQCVQIWQWLIEDYKSQL